MDLALHSFEDLKKLPQWVCYNKRKMPFSPLTGKGADCSNPDTWGTYEQAVTAWRNNPKWYVGVGFEFVKGQGITGIDLDHCIDEHGTIDQWAQKIIDRFKSYCETSPSGTGIHIFVRGILPNHAGTKKPLPGKRHPKAAIEMYDSGRYFTVTGKHLNGAPLTIEEGQQTLEKLYARLKQGREQASQREPPTSSPAPTSSPLSDNDLLEKARNASNGQKFTALWRGDTSDYQGDESSADLALCTMLAFWTGKDALRIDRLFRQSGLMRKKWDGKAREGETYGEGTIKRAIAQCSDIYNPLEEPGRLKQQITSVLSSLNQHQSKLSTGEQEARPTLITQKASELVKKQIPDPRWAVPDMIPEGVTLMTGKPKIGKSWAALNIGLGVASGGYVFGKIEVEAGRVLYLALEDHERRLQDRLIQMMEAMGATTIPELLEYVLTCPRFDAGGLELLENWIKDHPDARLILIDTWAKIAPRPRGRARSLYDEDHDAMAPCKS